MESNGSGGGGEGGLSYAEFLKQLNSLEKPSTSNQKNVSLVQKKKAEEVFRQMELDYPLVTPTDCNSLMEELKSGIETIDIAVRTNTSSLANGITESTKKTIISFFSRFPIKWKLLSRLSEPRPPDELEKGGEKGEEKGVEKGGGGDGVRKAVESLERFLYALYFIKIPKILILMDDLPLFFQLTSDIPLQLESPCSPPPSPPLPSSSPFPQTSQSSPSSPPSSPSSTPPSSLSLPPSSPSKTKKSFEELFQEGEEIFLEGSDDSEGWDEPFFDEVEEEKEENKSATTPKSTPTIQTLETKWKLLANIFHHLHFHPLLSSSPPASSSSPWEELSLTFDLTIILDFILSHPSLSSPSEKQTDESEQTQEKQEKEIAISSVFSSSWGALCCRLAEKPDEIEKVLCDLLEKREEREKEGGEGGGEEEGRGTGRGFDYFIFSLLGNVFEMGGWSVAKKTEGNLVRIIFDEVVELGALLLKNILITTPSLDERAFVTIEKIAQVLWWGAKRSVQHRVKIDTVLIQNGFWLTCCQVVVQAEKEQKNTKLFLDFFLFLLVREKTLADFAFRAHRKHPLFEGCDKNEPLSLLYGLATELHAPPAPTKKKRGKIGRGKGKGKGKGKEGEKEGEKEEGEKEKEEREREEKEREEKEREEREEKEREEKEREQREKESVGGRLKALRVECLEPLQRWLEEDTQEGFPQEKIEKVKQVLGVELSFWGTIDEIYSCCPPGKAPSLLSPQLKQEIQRTKKILFLFLKKISKTRIEGEKEEEKEEKEAGKEKQNGLGLSNLRGEVEKLNTVLIRFQKYESSKRD